MKERVGWGIRGKATNSTKKGKATKLKGSLALPFSFVKVENSLWGGFSTLVLNSV